MSTLSAAFCIIASAALSQPLSLQSPVDCGIGEAEDCFIQNYVDHDPSSDFTDFTCNRLSYDQHKGTDFALRSEADIGAGIDVFAAAPGTVKGTRDGIDDIRFTEDRAAAVKGRECGNGVVIAHQNGWETQYCHLKKGSVSVNKGQTVRAGDVLGEVGMSGQAAFPHVHFELRRGSSVVDPFAPAGAKACGTQAQETLWQKSIEYQPTGLISLGFSPHVPQYDEIKAGTAHHQTMRTKDEALVLWGQAFGGQPGDVLHLRIYSPQGLVFETKAAVDKHQVRYFRAGGRKTNSAHWFVPGTYQGVVTLFREGREVSEKTVTVDVSS